MNNEEWGAFDEGDIIMPEDVLSEEEMEDI